ncbi:uncharacterized protein PG998_009032 [Apiospora kogelbergensis]|uniref:uncharacterized protein n=1 Tax=Apiospora kogelbergensis TaxID=1337665 RepID=UPI00312D1E96
MGIYVRSNEWTNTRFLRPSQAVAPGAGVDDDVDAPSECGALRLAIFILAYAIGPPLLGPLPKTYGRSIVRQLANLLYFAFNTLPLERRGEAGAIHSLARLLDPSIGTIFGGFVAENTTW